MKTAKIVSFVAGLSLLATSLLPGTATAANVSLSLAGGANTTGTFSATVYANTGEARVTTAKIDLGFSAAVTNVSYDYSVGNFTTPTPSGAHVAQGSYAGYMPIARVSFRAVSTGTVTTSVGGSFLKGVSDDGTAVVTHSLSGAAASFTFEGGKGGEQPTNPATNPGTTNPSTNPSTTPQPGRAATTNTGPVGGSSTAAVAGTSAATSSAATTATPDTQEGDKKTESDDKQSDDANKDGSDNANASGSWLWLLALLAVIAGVIAGRRVAAARASAASKAAAAADEAKAAVAAKTAAKAKKAAKKDKK